MSSFFYSYTSTHQIPLSFISVQYSLLKPSNIFSHHLIKVKSSLRFNNAYQPLVEKDDSNALS